MQGWVVGALGIAYLKIRESGIVNAADQKLLTDWMKTVSKQTMDYYDDRLETNRQAEQSCLLGRRPGGRGCDCGQRPQDVRLGADGVPHGM